MATSDKVKVTLLRSAGAAAYRRLGARPGAAPPHQSVVIADTAENRGMINAACHMLKVERS
jgi:hypothetical protein